MLKTKNKAVRTVASSNGSKKHMKHNLSVKKYITPIKFGQFNSLTRTVISTDPEKRDQGLVHCYGCGRWVEDFAEMKVWNRPGAAMIRHGFCKKCSDALKILPPNLQRQFIEKSRRNLIRALEGNQDA